jgi:hypothetical protein
MVFATDVRLREHWLRVTFTDGAVKEVDLSDLLAAGGVFARIYASGAVRAGRGQS